MREREREKEGIPQRCDGPTMESFGYCRIGVAFGDVYDSPVHQTAADEWFA